MPPRFQRKERITIRRASRVHRLQPCVSSWPVREHRKMRFSNVWSRNSAIVSRSPLPNCKNVIPGMELMGKAMAASVRTAFRKPFNVRCRLRILKMLSVMPSVSVAIPIPSAASPVPLLKLFMGCLRTCVKKR